MPETYQHVFAPIKLGPIEIPNRLYFSAHSMYQGRTVNDDYARYMEERAAGGVGLLIHSTSVTAVPGWQAPHHEASIPAYTRVAESVHRHGSRIFAQISYAWAWPIPWQEGAPERPALAPSVHGGFATFAVAREITRATLDPDFERNKWVYVYYSPRNPAWRQAGSVRRNASPSCTRRTTPPSGSRSRRSRPRHPSRR